MLKSNKYPMFPLCIKIIKHKTQCWGIKELSRWSAPFRYPCHDLHMGDHNRILNNPCYAIHYFLSSPLPILRIHGTPRLLDLFSDSSHHLVGWSSLRRWGLWEIWVKGFGWCSTWFMDMTCLGCHLLTCQVGMQLICFSSTNSPVKQLQQRHHHSGQREWLVWNHLRAVVQVSRINWTSCHQSTPVFLYPYYKLIEYSPASVNHGWK